MPVPVVRNKATTAIGSSVTSFSVTMPTHVAGDLLVVIAAADGTPTMTTASTGWVKLDGSSNYAASAVFAKVAESASETLTVASTASEQYRATGWSFTSHGVTDVATLETARAFGDTSGTGEVPAITVSKALSYFLVAAIAGESGGSTASSNFTPTGVTSPWTNFSVAAATSTSDAAQATAETTLVGPTSLAAGTWTRSTAITRGFFSSVVAIPGAPDIPPSSGSVVALSTVAGAVTLSMPATGRTDAFSTVAATATKRSPASGVVTTQTVITASAEVIPWNLASGAVSASSVVTGAVSVNAGASARTSALSTIAGNPTKQTTASSFVSAQSDIAGGIRLRRDAAGAVSTISSVFGALKMIQAPVLPPTPLVRPEANLTVAGKVLAAVDGDVSLDSARVPYCMASVEVALTDAQLAESIDPRTGIRASLLGVDAGTTSRSFNLGIVERTVDHAAKTMKLDLASDEALLIDYAALVKDTGAFAKQNSLRAVVNHVLAKVSPGASLAAGGFTDTPIWVNYALNPTAEFDVANWYGGTNSTSPQRIATSGPDDGTYIFFNQHTAGEWRGAQSINKSVAPGDVLTFEFDLRTHRDVDFVLEVNASGAWSGSAGIQKRGAGWSHHKGTITVSAGTNLDAVQFYAPNSSPGSWDIANLRLIHSNIDRAADLLTWQPGTSAWDFIAPIVTTVGVKLWCDEKRVWRLTDPADYSVPGVLSVAGFNAVEGKDTITRRDPEVFCTGVLVRYKWRDATGNQREMLDAAGSAGQVLVIDFDRAYTGPGAAAAILARRAGAGRVQEVTALSDWTATPGMEARITLPSTADQQGLLTSVSWSLTEGVMDVGTKGLLDLVRGSINALSGTIDQLPGTIDQL